MKIQIKMSKKDIAEWLGVDAKTIYNWRKHKPNLYRAVILGLRCDVLMLELDKLSQELPADSSVTHPILRRANESK